MIKDQLKEAKKACRFMQNVKPEVKNKALKTVLSKFNLCKAYLLPFNSGLG